jgi:hypothetical protein
MAVRLPKTSRLRFAQLGVVDGVEFWDVVDLPEIPRQPDDIVHTVIDVDRIDLLAYRYYEDARLWWVIAVANGIELVPTELNTGDQLRIPAPRYVTQVLFQSAIVQGR